MTHSVGIDLVEVDRIRTSYNRHHDRFLQRVFSDAEIAIILSRKAGKIATMSGKFAAKEAVIKALDPFFEAGEVFLKDIEILNTPSGKPFVNLSEKLAGRMTGKKILLSISHERAFAAALVTITDDE